VPRILKFLLSRPVLPAAIAALLLILSGFPGSRARFQGAEAQSAVQVSYHAGWNLIGGPSGTQLSGDAGGLLTLTPDGGSYENVDSATPLAGGAGYWIYFPTDSEVSLPAAPARAQSLNLTAGVWSLTGNPFSQAVRLSGMDAAFGFDPAQGYAPLSVLPPGHAAFVYSSTGGALTLAPLPDTIVSLPSSAPASAPALTAAPVAAPQSGVQSGLVVLDSGVGQAKAGGPVTVAALIRNEGPAIDLSPITITVYDAGGTVIAAGDTTLHYLPSGETTGFAHRLAARGTGVAVSADIQAGQGRIASDPQPGGLSFGGMTLVSDRTGMSASAVLSSTYTTDLSEVRVDAVAYDGRGTIIGGGEMIKRLVPAGSSVGVLVSLDVSASPARVELYATLP
jgi:hypothetical protein